MEMGIKNTQYTDLVVWAAQALEAAGIENARFEAQLLLAMTLGVSRSSIVAQTYPAPCEAQQTRFADLVRQRSERIPMAYLRGSQEFYGREFLVTPAVLVPRPETELLVEKILMLLNEKVTQKEELIQKEESTTEDTSKKGLQRQNPVLLADVGTGSGCIPVSILGEQTNLRALAFDLSEEALGVARQNAAGNGVGDRIRFVQGDLLTGARGGSFDIIVSNPPYIPSSEIASLQKEVSVYEPRLALDGGTDGLDIYRRLIVQAYQALKSPGWLALEVGCGQADDVAVLLRQAGYEAIQTSIDLAGIARVVQGQKT